MKMGVDGYFGCDSMEMTVVQDDIANEGSCIQVLEQETPLPCGSGTNMTPGMSTTVPHSMVQHDLNCSHVPSSSQRRLYQAIVHNPRNTLHVKCCRAAVILVILQFLLGVSVTSLAFYMQAVSSVFLIRECPFWTGIPLCLAGIFGIYHCATDFVTYSGSKKAYVVKCICVGLSTLCVCLCLIGAIFPGAHSFRIFTYTSCQHEPSSSNCFCVQSTDPLARLFIYKDMATCQILCTTIKLLLLSQCILNAIGGIISFTFVILLWRSRYGNFYAGLKFYSYAADVPPHPWFDPRKPPYTTTLERNSTLRRSQQLTVRQASAAQSRTSLHRI